MNKILLAFEDYSELMATETTLKKVGFDVLGVTSEYSMADQMLAFNPDLVIVHGRTSKMSSLSAGKRLKELAWWEGKVVLIFNANAKPQATDLNKIRADIMLEAPVLPPRLIQVVAKLLNENEAALLERMNKASYVDPTDNSAIIVSSAPGSSSADSDDEESGFFNMLKKADDLYKEAPSGVQKNPKESLFPDIDINNLGSLLEDPKKNKALEKDDFNEAEVALQMREELQKAHESVAERVAHYSELTKDTKVDTKKRIRRVDTRQKQKELEKSWDKEKIKDIDSLRRKFVSALFKK